jgi:4-amino-4-deoxy-L-arabinose transferase-like glycosyltransferase
VFQDDGHKGLLRGLFWAIPFWAVAMSLNLHLTDQEAYYWTWAKNLDWSYFDHPPLQAWLTAFFTGVFGDSALAVRLPGLLFRTAALALFVIWASDRWSRTVAKRGLWILLGTFLSLAGALIALPDSIFAFFAMWTLIEADRRNSLRAGIALGFAALTKWKAFCLIPGVIWAFTTNRRGGPKWGGLITAGVIAILIQTPVLYWNYIHDWASFRFHLIDRHTHSPGIGEMFTNFFAFFSYQFLLGGFTFLGALIVAFWILYRRGFSSPILGYNRSASVRVPVWVWVLPFFIIFGWSAIKGESRFYWTAFTFFPICGALASVLNFSNRAEEQRFEWKMLLLTLGTMTMISVILLYPVGAWLKPYTDRFTKYDLRFSPRGDLIGWDEWVQKDLVPLGLTAENVGYIGADFRVASQLAWTLDLKPPRFGSRTKHNQFRFWPSPQEQNYPVYVLFGDNRYKRRGELNRLCSHKLSWQTRPINLSTHTIKNIFWATCTSLK